MVTGATTTTATELVLQKKRMRVTKKIPKKTKKRKIDIIEVGESEEENEEGTSRMKWRDFEVPHLIAI